MTLWSPQSRAIVWAQLRSVRNRLPRSNKLGLAFTVFIGIVWYGLFTAIALAVAAALSQLSAAEHLTDVLAGGLLLAFLYWLIIPVLLASKGASLEMRKLLPYPVPAAQFFHLEMLLRLTVGIEVLIVACGAFCGLMLNPAVAKWAPFALVPFLLFTLCVAIGVHDFISRLAGRRGVREIAALFFIMAFALPRLLLMRGGARQIHKLAFLTSHIAWPWTAAASAATGRQPLTAWAIVIAWAIAAYWFGQWQFARTLRFDAAAAAAVTPQTSRSRLEWFYRFPGMLLRDPIGVLIEKELRILTRAPRFRLVFVMGFSFGLVVWWPIAFGRAGRETFLGDNFMAAVSLYAVLLLSEVLFWNAFGFDRGAIQLYFTAPLTTRQVLLAKNAAAGLFIFIETTIAVAVCALLHLPFTGQRVLEAYAVTIVVVLLLVSVGNVTSFYSPKPVDPMRSFRAARSGRIQGLMLMVYPIAGIPLFLAYGARYAFGSETAFFIILAAAAVFGIVLYRMSLDSASDLAARKKEAIVSVLARTEGPVEG